MNMKFGMIAPLACVGVIVATLPMSLTAQAGYTLVSAPESVNPIAKQVFAKLVSVKFDSVTIKTAVKTIAASANVRIQFQGNELDAVAQHVTLNVSEVPLRMALEMALNGTALTEVALDNE